jgi:glycosyltransferase involved in cell wall biosynthesis
MNVETNLLNFSHNVDSISYQAHIESVLLHGNPDNIADAQLTICITTYKRPRLLKEAIQSAVNQATDIPYRIIVVDNDSDFNNTEVLEIVQSFPQQNLSYYKNKENLGAGGNMNRGIVLAKTKWAALLHDDDVLLENYVKEISAVLEKYGKDLDAVSPNYKILDTRQLSQIDNRKWYDAVFLALKMCYKAIRYITIVSWHRKRLIRLPLWGNAVLGDIYGPPSCGIAFRRTVFISSGGFDVMTPRPSNDWFFFIYFSQKYRFVKFRTILSLYRFEDNDTFRPKTMAALKKERILCNLSLRQYSKVCRLFMLIFNNDFNEENILNDRKPSILFHVIGNIYFASYLRTV